MSNSIDTAVDLCKGCLEFVFPPLCSGCGEFDATGTGVCEDCRERLDAFVMVSCLHCGAVLGAGHVCQGCADQGLPLLAFADYSSPMREFVIDIKFRGIVQPVQWLVGRLVQNHRQSIAALKADLLVPVPLHKWRERRRGYNQAELISEELSRLMEVATDTSLISRTVSRRPQSRLNFERREGNIAGVFHAEASSEKYRILLVDDVVTSGATAGEAARVLNDEGHRVVGVIALAHGI